MIILEKKNSKTKIIDIFEIRNPDILIYIVIGTNNIQLVASQNTEYNIILYCV